VEYEALGMDFTTRGRGIGEQVELLRRLWTEQTVTSDGSTGSSERASHRYRRHAQTRSGSAAPRSVPTTESGG
jgi:alkanesulfonate monooxygenase SsuD/methylene tetrahydromethanopterin reductase-like flavin-dependent oxidoreductase (luciferase family)